MRRILIFLSLVASAWAAADDRTNGLTQFSGALARLSQDERRFLHKRAYSSRSDESTH